MQVLCVVRRTRHSFGCSPETDPDVRRKPVQPENRAGTNRSHGGNTLAIQMNPLNAYRETRVKTASQGKLIVMLYDEAVKQMDNALSMMEGKTKQYDKVNACLLKTQDIITELMASLDFEKGGDIARNLFSLYMFFNQQLMDANIQKDVKPIQDVRRLMNDLKGAWIDVTSRAQDHVPATGGVNIAG